MPHLSKVALNMKRSGIREIMDLALGVEGVIRLEVGEPLFNTPEHIIEATNKAGRKGFTKYTANQGLLSLREKISGHINNKYNLKINSDNVIVSIGAVGAISTAVRVLADAGDEILIPDPSWPNYKMMITSIGAVPKYYKLDPDRGFLPTIKDLESLVTDKTKIIIINSPSNPLGVVFPEETIRELVEFAKEKDLFIISDEVYEEIVFQGRHVSTLPYDTDGRIVGVFSFSKTYAMTGYRVGYAIANKSIITQMAKLQEASVSCVSGISQKAAEGALEGSKECIKEMLEVYRENMNIATNLLDKYEITYQQPQGAFYIWIDAGCRDSTQFAKEFLLEHKVSIAPGDTFGPIGASYIRISLASPKESIIEGIHRLAETLGKQKLALNK